jgi:inositol 2-dehydrogenase
MTKPVGVGLAGLGRMGRLHAFNLAGRIGAAKLVRVVDAEMQIAESEADRLGVDASNSFDDLLDDPAIDAVVIVTPTSLHVPMIEKAAEAGKHVFCEKPIAYDIAETRRALTAVRNARVKLQIGFHRRFDPDWVAARTRIAAGELGEVMLFRTSLRDKGPPPARFLSGTLRMFADTSIHDLDTARWMIGEIEEVTVFGNAIADDIKKLGDVETAVIVLRFESGALGVIDNSRSAGYGYECTTEILGSQATIRVGDNLRGSVEWLMGGTVRRDLVYDYVERFPQAYLAEMEEFVTSVAEDGAVSVTGEDGLAAFTLAAAADLSLREKRTVRLGHGSTAESVIYEIVE